MTAGSLTLTCLLLAVGQMPGDVLWMNQRNMKVPVDIKAERRQEIKELILYVSTDRGVSWQQEHVMAPDKDSFPFLAPRDGEYWFRVASKTHQGKQDPENIYADPEHHVVKIVVDMLKPGVRFVSPQRQGEEVVAGWEIQDSYPDLASMKLFYRQGDTPATPWLPANFSPALVGKAVVRVPGGGPIALRLEVKDLAGNLSFAQVDVPAAEGFTRAGFTPEPAPIPPPVPPPSGNPAPFASPPVAPPVQPGPMPPPVPPFMSERAPAPPPPESRFGVPPVPPRAAPPVEPGPTFEVVASSKAPPALPVPPAPPEVPAVAPGGRVLPPLQVVNNTDVIMEYELEKVGPSGIGKVELYLTRDDGQSWVRFADDPKADSVMGDGPCRRLVPLPGEGVYGFSLVALSKAGRGKRPPIPGDVPEMRVEVDLTQPEVELGRPVPDPARSNALLLQWIAKDRNLAPQGATLEWSETREGPWNAIAANLIPGTGRHSWDLPRGLPLRIFIRLKVRDNAGNEAVVVTPEPNLADLSVPVGRLLHVSTPPRQP